MEIWDFVELIQDQLPIANAILKILIKFEDLNYMPYNPFHSTKSYYKLIHKAFFSMNFTVQTEFRKPLK